MTQPTSPWRHTRAPSPKNKNFNVSPDSPSSLLLIVNLISHFFFISTWNLIHDKKQHKTKHVLCNKWDVSVSTITLIRKKKGPLLLHQAPYRSLTLHHASNLLLACEAATAHHAILVPALYMRFTVSSFPHFLPAVRGRLNSLSSPLTLRTTLFSLEIHLLYPHLTVFFFKLIKKVEKKKNIIAIIFPELPPKHKIMSGIAHF